MKLEAFIRAHSSGNPETVNLYLRECRRFTGWLGTRTLTLESAQEYEEWLRGKYRANSLQNKAAAVNLYLKWKGTDYRIKRPRPEVLANPKLITDAEYEALIGAITDPAERLVVRILHDSFLRPSDVVNVRLSDIDRSEGATCIRKETRKTGAISESYLTKETAAELEAYIKSAGITDYLFPGENGRAFRNRTWPNAVLRNHGAEGITPRTFRRTGATRWGADIRSLMSQGGWKDPKVILTRYRRDERERHIAEFEKAMGQVKDRSDPDDPPGYA